MEIQEVYKTIDAIVNAQKKARKANDYLTLLVNAEAMLEYLPNLINFQIEQEKCYRKFEAELGNKKDDNGKFLSSSYCETQAKATDYYSEWQRARKFEELVYEMVKLGKMLARSVDKEYNAS